MSIKQAQISKHTQLVLLLRNYNLKYGSRNISFVSLIIHFSWRHHKYKMVRSTTVTKSYSVSDIFSDIEMVSFF